MRDWGPVFKGKKVTVMGLGLLGRGVGDAKFLAEQGAELIVTDLKDAAALSSSLEALSSFSNITYRLGGHDLADFKGRDYILKAAGVPLDSPYIAEARKNKIPIKMSASWFAELAGIPVVGITGTRGKTTTVYFAHEIMKAASIHTLLGGNIRGVSTLALLPQVTPGSIALMELDSWQLQGWGEAEMSPTVAVFTTFLSDHMNYYRNDMDAYLADKANIFLYQKPEDTLVVSTQVAPLIKERYGAKVRAHVAIADPAKLHWPLKIPGAHNRLNAACAREVAHALGIDEELIRVALERFPGVPGRLELVREVNGVKIYNDTTATTPDATLAALGALDRGDKNIVLIMGGADKKLDMTPLTRQLGRVKKAVYLAGTGTDAIGVTDAHIDLASAVADAWAACTPGDILLFSPAFASFGIFKNEYDRNDQFNTLINALV